MKLLIDHTIGQPISEQETLGDVEKVSLEWLKNVSNTLQKGYDITDSQLSRYGRKEVILAYFPMADPNWVPNMDDIKRYINNNVPEQKRIIEEVNKQLSSMDGETLVYNTGSHKLGSLDLGITEFSLGYLNYAYKVVLNKGRLTKYSNNFFSGYINLTPSASIRDGLFKNSSAELETSTSFKVGFNGKINNDKISLNFYPKNISVSTDWIGLGTDNVSLPGWVKTGLAALSLGLTSAFRIKLNNNKIYMKLTAFGRDWFKRKVGEVDVTSEVRKYLKNVNVTLPFDVIRKQKIPKSQESLNQLANNVAGGIKVEKS